MRISVECGGFTEAGDACRTANQVAALVTGTLAGRLGAYAGMAGDDATSSDFAVSYDAGAREAVAALVDLTHAFVGLGRLVDATGRNHAAAEAVAAGLPVGAYDGGGLDDDSFVRVSPADPPSALGRQEPSFGVVDRWILDHVEGFVWPGADVDVLRDAAATWRRTASSVAGLTDHLDVTARLLAHQRSPEIPLAVSAVESLSSLVVDTADQLMCLAQACEEYAAAVEEAHDRTRALLAEIAQMIVEGVALSVLVTGISGGLGGTATAGAALARIRTQAPRFHALLTALRATAATGAARLRSARESLRTARAGLEKFARVPVRSERGVMKNPLGWGSQSLRARPRPDVEDAKLNNYVSNLFKGVDSPTRIGDGTTMDAIRHELTTGESVHNRRHLIKGRETLAGLRKWLQHNPHASPGDRTVAQDLIAELEDALSS